MLCARRLRVSRDRRASRSAEALSRGADRRVRGVRHDRRECEAIADRNRRRSIRQRGGADRSRLGAPRRCPCASRAVRRSPAHDLRALHAPRAADWSLLAFSIIAPIFIGPTASVSRSSIGIGLYAISRILQRPTTLENLWCVAALVRLMIAPSDLTDVSFQLTYAGA